MTGIVARILGHAAEVKRRAAHDDPVRARSAFDDEPALEILFVGVGDYLDDDRRLVRLSSPTGALRRPMSS